MCWLTYTDADNDPPNYVRCERSTTPGTSGLQPPVNNMIANDSGDVTYTDGKQYYFNWFYFPFVGTGFILFMVQSGADAQVTKFVVCFQQVEIILSHLGVTPADNNAGNHTFFANYTDTFNNPPNYLYVYINGISYSMSKNNSSDTHFVIGVDYFYTSYLLEGNNTFAFKAQMYYTVVGNPIYSGTFWIKIHNDTANNNVFLVLIVASLLSIFIILIVATRKKE